MLKPAIKQVQLRGGSSTSYCWDGVSAPLLMLHGWGDTGRSFGFLAELLTPAYASIAFDWRGFGASFRAPGNYYFPDYLADLDEFLDITYGDQPVTVVAHSMGGNIAALYAGIRPERVQRLVLLESFGLADVDADQAPNRYRRWLDDQKRTGSERPRALAALESRISEQNPSLGDGRVSLVAQWWSEPVSTDYVKLKMDARHRRRNPILYRRAEAVACWRGIRAPVLLVRGQDSHVVGSADVTAFRKELSQAEDVTELAIDASGHNVHLEAPEQLADALQDWLACS